MRGDMRWLALVVVLFVLPTFASANVGGQAQKTYNHLWRKASRFYGVQGQPPPQFQKMPRGDFGSLHTDRSGPVPVVSAKSWILRDLAGKGKANRRASWHGPGRFQRIAEKSLLHEWAHVYQRPEIWNDVSTAERDASQFAQALAKRLLRPKGKRVKVPLDRSQFGS